MDCFTFDEQVGAPVEAFTPKTVVNVATKESSHVVSFGFQKTACSDPELLTPLKQSLELSNSCSYDSGLTSSDNHHRGLGFCDESTPKPIEIIMKRSDGEESSVSETEIDADENYVSVEEEMPDETVAPPQSSGFLAIGGMRLYTHDITDQEEDSDDEGSTDGESTNSLSESEESEDVSDDTSEIDDEIVADYIKGIGGIGGLDDTINKFSVISLQEASMEYGMQKPVPKKYSAAKFRPGSRQVSDMSNIDDIMHVKDARSHLPKKKHPAVISKSFDSARKDTHRRFPGMCISAYIDHEAKAI